MAGAELKPGHIHIHTETGCLEVASCHLQHAKLQALVMATRATLPRCHRLYVGQLYLQLPLPLLLLLLLLLSSRFLPHFVAPLLPHFAASVASAVCLFMSQLLQHERTRKNVHKTSHRWQQLRRTSGRGEAALAGSAFAALLAWLHCTSLQAAAIHVARNVNIWLHFR